MRKTMALFMICITALFCSATGLNAHHGSFACERIKDGTLLDSEGEPIELGFNIWGYNYQARIFSGGYCEAYKDAEWCQEYKDVTLYMKWNDAWLSNKDCDGDGALDRHFGYDSYLGSGARLINFQKGTYIDEEGQMVRWIYFTKIMAAPVDAILNNGEWFNKKGKLLGPQIWEDFYVKKEVYKEIGETSDESAMQAMGKAAGPFINAPYLDPYSVDFDQFTPKD